MIRRSIYRDTWPAFAAAFFLISSFAFMLQACGAYGERVNPVKAAVESGRPDLIAYAIEGSYTIVQSKAREVAEDPATPDSVKSAIADIAARANPILDKMRPLADEASDLRAKLKAIDEQGLPDDAEARARIAVVLADLNRLLSEVSPMVSDLAAAITGG